MSEVHTLIGSGGGGKAFAYIHVTYPEGSVCTCSKDGKTLTAKDTSGVYNFGVPEAGEWVVSCTDGSKTASDTISISEELQVKSVSIAYELVIYSYGTEYVPMSNGMFTGQSKIGTYSASSDHFTLGAVNADTSIGRCTNSKVNLTTYTSLQCVAQKTAEQSNFVKLIVASSNDRPQTHTVSSVDILSAKTAYAIDISQLTGEYYIAIGVATSSSANQTWTDVYEIKLV